MKTLDSTGAKRNYRRLVRRLLLNAIALSLSLCPFYALCGCGTSNSTESSWSDWSLTKWSIS